MFWHAASLQSCNIVLFSLLTFSIAKKRLRQWDEWCDPYPSDNSVMTWLVPVYVHLLFLLVRIPPWKLTCHPKRDHFVQGHESSSNHQLSGYIRWFSRGYVQWVWYLFHTDGWWLMVHVEVFLEACPHCCYHGEKEASWIHVKTFQAKSCCTFARNLHLPNHQPRFFILFWRDIYDSDGRTEINFRKGVGSVFHVGIQG